MYGTELETHIVEIDVPGRHTAGSKRHSMPESLLDLTLNGHVRPIRSIIKLAEFARWNHLDKDEDEKDKNIPKGTISKLLSLKVFEAHPKYEGDVLEFVEISIRDDYPNHPEAIPVIQEIYRAKFRLGLAFNLEAALNEARTALTLQRANRSKMKGESTDTLHRIPKVSAAVLEYARDSLYIFEGGCVEAIRVFGDAEDFIPESRVTVDYCHDVFVRDPDLAEEAEAYVELAKADAATNNKLLFNGPNSRLLDWKDFVADDSDCGRENLSLRLSLGPVGYYDYTGLNAPFRRRAKSSSLAAYRNDIGLDDILDHGDLLKGRLSGIVDIAGTIITKDGWIGYSLRGQPVVEGGMLTSSIAENINRFKDDADSDNSRDLFNPAHADAQEQGQSSDNSYEPKGVPHPFAACRRGFEEELSPGLLKDIVGDAQALLTGISFDLYSGHPDLLFVYPIPCKREQAQYYLDHDRGKDRKEGKPLFMRHEFANHETLTLLRSESWLPGGLASIVRTMELLRSLKTGFEGSFPRAFEQLRRASSGC